jgi:hypothetical protein
MKGIYNGESSFPLDDVEGTGWIYLKVMILLSFSTTRSKIVLDLSADQADKSDTAVIHLVTII